MNDARVLQADWPVPAQVTAGTVLRNGSVNDLPGKPIWIEQVHGSNVVTIGSSDFDSGAPQADAVIARGSHELCVVRTADCLPILAFDKASQSIAAIHAGWRGLAAGVIDATLDKLQAQPSELLVWLGPAISQAAFEVGGEVRDAFLAQGFSAAAFERNSRGRWQADLYALAIERLAALGIPRVYGGGLCTHGDADRFPSFRRDASRERLLNFIVIAPT